MIYRILYCSCNRLVGSSSVQEQIDSILEASRRNNAVDDITGALIFNERVFAQVLEGPRSSVERIYTAIRSDPRHDHIVLLEAAYVAGRDFGNWTMAFAETEIDDASYRWLDFRKAKADPLGEAENTLAVLKILVKARA